MEDDKFTIDPKIPLAPANQPVPVPTIQQWRESLQQMPEWDSLPDGFHSSIIRRLRNTGYPTEPSGHSSWKHVKNALRAGKQPDWDQLAIATFIWRVKRKRPERPDMAFSADLPDTFVAEANLHTPPIDIIHWPTKDMAVAEWQPKTGPIPQREVKPEIAAQAQLPGLWAPHTPATREATASPAPREKTVVPEHATTALPALGAISGNAGPKRPRPADEETPTHRPAKRPITSTRTEADHQATPAALANLAVKVADGERRITHLTRDLSDRESELEKTNKKLDATVRKLDDVATELGELRAIAMSDRRYIRRIVTDLASQARAREQEAGQMRMAYDRMAENMG